MTIDTLFGKRFYLLIILELKSRRIIRFDLTENPCREFVKRRIVLLSEDFPDKKTLIHDNAAQFTSIDYRWFDIKGVNISPFAPNMNAFVERLNGSICLQRPMTGIPRSFPDQCTTMSCQELDKCRALHSAISSSVTHR